MVTARRFGRYAANVAHPARRVKDKRLRRAFGILDTVCWMGFRDSQGVVANPCRYRVDLAEFGWAEKHL